MAHQHLVNTICAADLSAALIPAPVLADSHEQHTLDPVVELFADGAIVGEPSVVDCILSEGAEARCIAISVVGIPVDHELGPLCPNNIADGEDAGGLWLEYGEVQDLGGAFIANLVEINDDPVWNMFDPETGDIHVTRALERSQLAARPQDDPDYNNYCVQCAPDYYQHSTVKTYVLPITPVAATAPRPVTDDLGVGVALSGAWIDGPAPKKAILAAHRIAAFDDCGGQLNLGVGYHYHALMGCSEEAVSAEGRAPIVGIATNDHLLHAQLDESGAEPTDMDACRGHYGEGLGYHYHANEAGGEPHPALSHRASRVQQFRRRDDLRRDQRGVASGAAR